MSLSYLIQKHCHLFLIQCRRILLPVVVDIRRKDMMNRFYQWWKKRVSIDPTQVSSSPSFRSLMHLSKSRWSLRWCLQNSRKEEIRRKISKMNKQRPKITSKNKKKTFKNSKDFGDFWFTEQFSCFWNNERTVV